MNRIIVLVLLALAPQLSTASGVIRGIETDYIDRLSKAVAAADTSQVQRVFSDMENDSCALNLKEKSPTSTIESKILKALGRTPLKNLARELFNSVTQLQQANAVTEGDGQPQESKRKALVTLQIMLEETLMLSRQSGIVTYLNPNVKAKGELQVLGIPSRVGDIVVQQGSSYLSSHFIAQSQDQIGIASHALLISGGTGEQVEILESLIEDGVHRRPGPASSLGRLLVLALKDPKQRDQARDSTLRFISQEQIPLVVEGQADIPSPLRYDATMDFARIQDGAYFCTALVQEVYRRSGIPAAQLPYLLTASNWSRVSGLQLDLYRDLGINQERIPAPSDILMNPEFVIQGGSFDIEGLRISRRLRAVVESFYFNLEANAKLRRDLKSAFELIPSVEVDKAVLLKKLQALKIQAQAAGLISPESDAKIAGMIAKLQVSLPQSANLRQISFFVMMNSVLQDPMLKVLTTYEQKHGGHVSLAELASVANATLGAQLTQFVEILKLLGISKAE